jgi:hypothetical protein
MRSAAARPAIPPPDAVRQGEIRSSTIPYLFHDFASGRATGVLTVTDRDARKTVHVERGVVQFASSNEKDDRFNNTLLRESVLPLRDILKALEVALATKERLGEVMVSWKMLEAAEIEKWIRVHLREIVLSLFNLTSGRFIFEPKRPGGETITLGATGDAIVVDGVRRITSWVRAYEEVGGLNTEYRATKDAAAIVRDLPLLPAETDLLGKCDSPLSLGEVLDVSGLNNYQTCKSVWALLIIGALMKA